MRYSYALSLISVAAAVSFPCGSLKARIAHWKVVYERDEEEGSGSFANLCSKPEYDQSWR